MFGSNTYSDQLDDRYATAELALYGLTSDFQGGSWLLVGMLASCSGGEKTMKPLRGLSEHRMNF